MIQATNLSSYLFPRTGVENISFSMEKGETLAILGNSNSGRSSLLEILCGVLAPEEGDALIDGHSIIHDPIKAKQLIGYMPQQAPYFPNMTVREHLEFVFEIRKIKKNKKEHLIEIVENVELQEHMGHVAGKIPFSYQRKLSLACALVGYPPLLLLDRPTAGLNPNDTGNLLHIISSYRENHSILFSTSSPLKSELLSERVLVLNDGKLMADTTFSDIQNFTAPKLHKVHVRIGGDKETITDVLDSMDDIHWIETDTHEQNAYDYMISSESPYLRERLSQHIGENELPLLYMAGDFITLEKIVYSLTLKDDSIAQSITS